MLDVDVVLQTGGRSPLVEGFDRIKEEAGQFEELHMYSQAVTILLRILKMDLQEVSTGT